MNQTQKGVVALALTTLAGIAMAQTTKDQPRAPVRLAPDGDRVPMLTNYECGWLANSGPGHNSDRQWMQHFAYGMAVSSDGRVYLTSHWEESGRRGGIYKDGRCVGQADHRHGAEPSGEEVAVNSRYAYYTRDDGVLRYDLDGKNPSMLIDRIGGSCSGLAVDERRLVACTFDGEVKVFGLDGKSVTSWKVAHPGAVALAGEEVFVVSGVTRETREHKDQRREQWIWAEPGQTPVIVKYDLSGRELARVTCPEDVPGGWSPSAVAVDRGGNRLLVADAGRDQRVHVFDLGGLRRVATVGEPGGYLAGPVPGRTGPTRLMRPWGVGVDGQGNIYVYNCKPHTGGPRVNVRAFDQTGKELRWEMNGLAFVDTVQPDPATDGQVMYSGSDRFTYDFSAPAKGGHWKHEAVTYNPYDFPLDPREHSPFIVHVGGKTLMYTIGMFSSALAIHRFEEGSEIAKPAGYFHRARLDAQYWAKDHPDNGEFIWRDLNGNGQPDSGEYQSTGREGGETFCTWVDSKGSIWDAIYDADRAGDSKWNIREIPLEGLDPHGNPKYDLTKPILHGNPPELYEIGRLEYHPDSDTMYLMGFSARYPKLNDLGNGEPTSWGSAGRVVYRYDHWRTPRRQLHRGYPIEVPIEFTTARGEGAGMSAPVAPDQITVDFERSLIPAEFAVAGDGGASTAGAGYLFVAYGTRGPSTRQMDSRNEIRVYDADTGQLKGRMLAKAPIDPNGMGWLDTRRAMKVIRRSDGEYVVALEEDARGKFSIFRWKPAAGIAR